jgi:hypothetical protein
MKCLRAQTTADRASTDDALEDPVALLKRRSERREGVPGSNFD